MYYAWCLHHISLKDPYTYIFDKLCFLLINFDFLNNAIVPFQSPCKSPITIILSVGGKTVGEGSLPKYLHLSFSYPGHKTD